MMRDDLVSIALREGSTVLVEHLPASIRKYGEPRLTPVSLQMIELAAGDWAKAVPASGHAIVRWFRPVAQRLADVEVRTLGELIAYSNRRGGNWWRSLRRPARASCRAATGGCRSTACRCRRIWQGITARTARPPFRISLRRMTLTPCSPTCTATMARPRGSTRTGASSSFLCCGVCSNAGGRCPRCWSTTAKLTRKVQSITTQSSGGTHSFFVASTG